MYFLRHGETIYSETGAYCGELDAELTAEGVQLAKAFAEAYRSVAWTAVYVSPKKRTIASEAREMVKNALNSTPRHGGQAGGRP